MTSPASVHLAHREALAALGRALVAVLQPAAERTATEPLPDPGHEEAASLSDAASVGGVS
jgi:hypothetical protein